MSGALMKWRQRCLGGWRGVAGAGVRALGRGRLAERFLQGASGVEDIGEVDGVQHPQD